MPTFAPPPPYHTKSTSRSRLRTNPSEVYPPARSLLNTSRFSDGAATPQAVGSVCLSESRFASPATSSRTRQQLVELQQERDELQGAFDKERAISERLKLEGRTLVLSPAEKNSRHQSLKHEMRVASRETPRVSSVGMYKKVCSTDLLFLIDTTSSMQSHINAAKASCRSIVDSITKAFLLKAEVRMAVVGYRDHSDSTNIEFLDFTTSIDRVYSFLKGLKAYGGGDTPEDVLGGLSQALNATWLHQTRCIVHIADAPPHGSALQNSPISDDTYPICGTEPHGLIHQPLLAQMISMNINYALLRINDSTDRLASVLCDAYNEAEADGKLLTSNKYNYAWHVESKYTQRLTNGYLKSKSGSSGLIFEESELGTAYNVLQRLVVKVITTSATRSAMRASMEIRKSSIARQRKGNIPKFPILTTVEEDNVVAVYMEDVPPQWYRARWLDETLDVEGFLPDIDTHAASTLNDMIASNDNIKMSTTQLTIHKRSRPFAQGAMRTASYARTTASTNPFVVKTSRKSGKSLAHLVEEMLGQALCKAFALEFNALTGESSTPIDFIVTTCFGHDECGPGGAISGEVCMSLEPYIPGNYIKYNSNCGWVNDNADNGFNELAQAFTHFTFERSRGTLMASDMQGVGHILTDPCIHTKDTKRFKYIDGNLNSEGFMFFFGTHKCNRICTRLKLRSNGQMFKTNRWEFRDRWPELANTLCCSNKLCGKILHSYGAKRSNQFPGYQWCFGCWPQLHSTEATRICIGPGNHHEFRTSAFFYESQGQEVPRTCNVHRGASETRLEVEVGTDM